MDEKSQPGARKPRASAALTAETTGAERAKKSMTLRVGDLLEYRVARLFIWSDFFVRRGREIYTVAALDRATDLDVLAIRYAQPFHRDVQIAECKSDGDRPLDRIFWLSGVQEFVDADRATLIRRSTKWNIKDFAKIAGVEIIDLPRLEELENELGVDTSLWPGISDRDFFLKSEDEWNRALHRDELLTELCLTLASEVRYQDPFAGVNYLLHHSRALTRSLNERRLISESLGKFLLCDSISHLSMFLMRIAESSFALSNSDRSGLIRKGLTYGHMDPKLTDRIFRNAFRIATETLKHYGKTDVKLDESFFRMPTPPNVADIQEIIELLVTRARTSTSFGSITDLLLLEVYLKGRSPDWLSRIYRYSDLDERLRLVQQFVQFLVRIGAAPEDIERSLFSPAKTAKSQEMTTLAAPQGNGGSARTDTNPSLFSNDTESEQKNQKKATSG
jgi:hypothetical protein